MKLARSLLPLLMLHSLFACSKNSDSDTAGKGAAPVASANPCGTRYPILLVHGVGLPDSTLGINYFGRIPAYLKDNCGVPVFSGEQDALGVGENNGYQLVEQILKITDEMGYEKVNIIAHSKGGIDVRLMFFLNKKHRIEGRSINDRVASFTTLATPHRGSVLADFLFEKLNAGAEDALAVILKAFSFVVGDSAESNPRESLGILTHPAMDKWNQKMGDLDKGIDGVYCQSWAAQISGIISDPIFKGTSVIMSSIGAPINDGAVEEASAHYANYRGMVGSGMIGGVSHLAIVDKAQAVVPGITPGFDPRKFYQDILVELKGKGF